MDVVAVTVAVANDVGVVGVVVVCVVDVGIVAAVIVSWCRSLCNTVSYVFLCRRGSSGQNRAR